MSIKTVWISLQAFITGVGGWLGAWLGGLDGLIFALIAFTITDYATGVAAAIAEKRLSSAVGFKGIAGKVLIFTLVGLAHLLDVHVIGQPGVLRTAVIFFYLSNEGISLIENATRLGLPIPTQLRDVLDVIANHAKQRPPLTTNTANRDEGVPQPETSASGPTPAGKPETTPKTAPEPRHSTNTTDTKEK